MKVVIVFESMHGNTRPIAEAIASGFTDRDEVRVAPLAEVDPTSLDADLLVVGGRTWVLGPAIPGSSSAAVDASERDPLLTLDAMAYGAPLREWLHALPQARGSATAFDTRLDAPVPPLTGHASAMIAKSLERRGYELIVDPESFLVDYDATLIDGELERARRWGAALSAEMHSAERNTVNTVAGRVSA